MSYRPLIAIFIQSQFMMIATEYGAVCVIDGPDFRMCQKFVLQCVIMGETV